MYTKKVGKFHYSRVGCCKTSSNDFNLTKVAFDTEVVKVVQKST